MDLANIIQTTILTPLLLFFILGMIAARVKSDLKIPEAITAMASLYLLAAIGLHGGLEMRKAGLTEIVVPILVAVTMGILITMNHYQILRRIGKFNIFDASAVAGTYGSVSAATFSVGLAFLMTQGIKSDGYLAAILAILEPTGLIVAILISHVAFSRSNRIKQQKVFTSDSPKTVIRTLDKRGDELFANAVDMIENKKEQTFESNKMSTIIRETITSKSVLILLGSLVIGYMIGEQGFGPIKIVFEDAFKGVLVIYLLDMGIIAAQRLNEIKKIGPFLIAFAILIPVFNGTMGTIIATILGLGIGSSFMFGLLMASASYIAAPAVLRNAIPKANPSIYLTGALGVTFPFNVIVNITVLFTLANMFDGMFGVEMGG